MLAVAIMGVIIFALYSVFNETQQALRRSETQTDVSQRARMVVEMIGKEIEQAYPTFGFTPTSTRGVFQKENNMVGGIELPPMIQKSDRGDITPRTNYLHNIFFYNHRTNAWQGIGYRVVNVTNGVGVLLRFETNQFGHRPLSNRLSRAFQTETTTNRTFHHVADGVIHLTFVPYDRFGQRLGWDTRNRGWSGTNHVIESYEVRRQDRNGTLLVPSDDVTVTNETLATVLLQRVYQTPPTDNNQQYTTAFAFRSNAMPAFIEMELGILEPNTLEQFYTMVEDQNPNATNFLARQISKVHLFRQRIPIRTAAQ
jgi:type II secretory pathway component PulJ